MLMLKTVLRNFLKRPATRNYPFVKRDTFPGTRGRLINSMELCIFCRACSNKCPSQCIATDPKTAFWAYDPFSCVYCGICVDNCPTHSLTMLDIRRKPVPTKFVVYHKGVARVGRPKLKAVPNAPHFSEQPKVVPSVDTEITPPPAAPKPAARPVIPDTEKKG